MRELGEEAVAETVGSVTGAVFLVLIGLACLVGGGELSKEGAVRIAEMLGLSEALIGLTIVAFATSLPELITAIIACRKGHDDLAVGNVVGSNVFNLLLVLGLTAVVAPVALPGGRQGWQDLTVMLGITCVFMLMAFSHRRITRWEGAVLLVMYIAYMGWGVYREVGQT
jgi:cation:H+ antiporter